MMRGGSIERNSPEKSVEHNNTEGANDVKNQILHTPESMQNKYKFICGKTSDWKNIHVSSQDVKKTLQNSVDKYKAFLQRNPSHTSRGETMESVETMKEKASASQAEFDRKTIQGGHAEQVYRLKWQNSPEAYRVNENGSRKSTSQVDNIRETAKVEADPHKGEQVVDPKEAVKVEADPHKGEQVVDPKETVKVEADPHKGEQVVDPKETVKVEADPHKGEQVVDPKEAVKVEADPHKGEQVVDPKEDAKVEADPHKGEQMVDPKEAVKVEADPHKGEQMVDPKEDAKVEADPHKGEQVVDPKEDAKVEADPHKGEQVVDPKETVKVEADPHKGEQVVDPKETAKVEADSHKGEQMVDPKETAKVEADPHKGEQMVDPKEDAKVEADPHKGEQVVDPKEDAEVEADPHKGEQVVDPKETAKVEADSHKGEQMVDPKEDVKVESNPHKTEQPENLPRTSEGAYEKFKKEILSRNNIEKEYPHLSDVDAKKITWEQEAVIKNYTFNGYERINRSLYDREFQPRDKIEAKSLEASVEVMTECIDQCALQRQAKLYRGIQSARDIFGEDAKKLSPKELIEKYTGKEYINPAFTSTSCKISTANRFVGGYDGGLLTIKAPAGAKALCVGSVGHFGCEEGEVILQRGTIYKIDKITYHNNQYNVVMTAKGVEKQI